MKLFLLKNMEDSISSVAVYLEDFDTIKHPLWLYGGGSGLETNGWQQGSAPVPGVENNKVA